MRAVRLLVTLTLMLTVVTIGSHSGRVKGRDRVTNRRQRHRYNPYAVPPTTETVAEDYDEVEVSSYCRESVAHHEDYVRAITQAPNSSSKVSLYAASIQMFDVFQHQIPGLQSPTETLHAFSVFTTAFLDSTVHCLSVEMLWIPLMPMKATAGFSLRLEDRKFSL